MWLIYEAYTNMIQVGHTLSAVIAVQKVIPFNVNYSIEDFESSIYYNKEQCNKNVKKM